MSEPTAKAFRFVIDGQNQQYDAYIDLLKDFGTPWIDCRYRPTSNPSDKWSWLIGPNVGVVDTTESTDASFDAAIAVINAKIKEVFGTAGGTIPLKGLERIEWLIQVGLKEVDNVVSRV